MIVLSGFLLANIWEPSSVLLLQTGILKKILLVPLITESGFFITFDRPAPFACGANSMQKVICLKAKNECQVYGETSQHGQCEVRQ